ncbi:Thymidylate kinase [bacterium HR29]|nr:Thymidylate kinase [bacterium HR29]
MRRGRFIVLEGGEGTGKSTLLPRLAARLRSRGVAVVETREPGGTSVGEGVRVLLRDELDPWAETFLFLAARAQLTAEVIRPALAQGVWVICDRFAASTLAYQGYGRGLDLQALRLLNGVATGNLEPDLTILLDIDPVEGLRRKGAQPGDVRTGTEALAFHERVRKGYRELCAASPDRWVLVDAAQPLEAVESAAWDAVAALLL